MKFSLAFSSSSIASLGEGIGAWWRHHVRSVLIVFLFLVFVAGVATWYWSLFLYHWTDVEEQAYRQSKSVQTVFQEQSFQDLLNKIATRKSDYAAEQPPVRDLFFGEGG